jgi:protein O-mannosyl-transferase
MPAGGALPDGTMRETRGATPRVESVAMSTAHVGRSGGDAFVALGLALAATLACLPVLNHGFLNWDDDHNFTSNAHYRGLGVAQLRWMFTTFLMGHYTPLSWLTLGFDYVLWGMDPTGYHLTNLVVHALNAALVYVLACWLLRVALALPPGTGLRLAGAVTSLLFALHPLRVESVAWVSERRDVLSAMLYLLALSAYLRGWERRSADGALARPWYWTCLGLFTLALLAKAMAVSLPAVLLLLDIYPLRRVSLGTGSWRGAGAWRVGVEKVPFVALSLGAGLTALAAATSTGATVRLGWLERLGTSMYGLAFYLWKSLAPFRLSPVYELPAKLDPLSAPFVLSACTVVVITVAAVLMRRQWPALASVWAFYVITLLPVLGVAHAGLHLAADRYTYLPCLGWALLAGAGSWRVWLAWSEGELRGVALLGLSVLATVALATLGTLTWRQSQVWHDSETLWRHALTVSPSSTAHYHLGLALIHQGRVREATEHAREAVRIKPDSAGAHNTLGLTLAAQGEFRQAIEEFTETVRIDPRAVGARINLELAQKVESQRLK